MRATIVIAATVVAFAFLTIGHFYWKDKTSISSFNSAEAGSEKVKEPKTEKVDKVDSKDNEINDKNQIVDAKIFDYIHNWPKKAQEQFQAALENGDTYKLAIVGSPALGKETNGWSVMLRDQLIETFGEDNIEVGIFEYAVNSDQFIAEGHDKEVIEFDPDFILFEPFKWIDNSAAPQNNDENIEAFLDALKDAGSEAIMVLQPPHPVYNTTYYPDQVGKLKEFADNHDIDYWDHWATWPDDHDPKLEEYLLEDDSAPNAKGHQLWYEFLKERFISE